MPAKAQWMLQIPEILGQLRSLDAPVIDRAVCEKVFGVGRRRAVALMQGFGGYRSGNAVLVDREKLIIQLEALENGSDIARERRRKARLAEKLDHLHRYRAAAAVRIAVLPLPAAALPDGVAFTGRRMTVDYDGVEELLSKLYAVAQSSALDYERFRSAVDLRRPPAEQARASQPEV